MAERDIVVDTLMLHYQGVFSLDEFYGVIEKYLRENHFDKFVKRNEEQVFKDHKQILVEIEPWKKINEYVKEIIRLNINISNMKDVIVVKDKHRVRKQQGKIAIKFMGFLETDLEYRWEGHGILYFLRAFVDQFIYKIGPDKYNGQVAQDTQRLHTIIKSYLNMQRY